MKKYEFKNIIVWLIIFIVGSLIVTFLVSPNSFQSFKSNIKSLIPSSNTGIVNNAKNTEEPLITNCRNSFNECKDIVEQKYPSASFTLLKIEKFTDEKSAQEFYDTWKTIMVTPPLETILYGIDWTSTPKNFNDVSPIVLISLRMKGVGGEVSTIAVCNKLGELTKYSKVSLLCG